MQEYQQRVVEEKKALDEKIARLKVFIGTPTFAGLDAEEQARLWRQLKVMAEYSSVLAERIAAFTHPHPSLPLEGEGTASPEGSS
jgi:hypothetical protein